MHDTSLNKMKAFVEYYLKDYKDYPLKIIDLGSQSIDGHPTYRPFFNNPKWHYFGLDLTPGFNVDIVLKDPYKWDELEDSSFDVVISGQAFEHIEFPWITIKEVYRILKDRGIACIIAPSRGYEHRYPVDCWRFFPDGMNALGKWAGFKVIEVFTDWGLDPWNDTFVVYQKPETGANKISPFEEFSNKEVALKVYLEALKQVPQNPEYYSRFQVQLKGKGVIKKSSYYLFKVLFQFFLKISGLNKSR